MKKSKNGDLLCGDCLERFLSEYDISLVYQIKCKEIAIPWEPRDV